MTITQGKKKGKIALEYYDQDDLNALMKALETLNLERGSKKR